MYVRKLHLGANRQHSLGHAESVPTLGSFGPLLDPCLHRSHVYLLKAVHARVSDRCGEEPIIETKQDLSATISQASFWCIKIPDLKKLQRGFGFLRFVTPSAALHTELRGSGCARSADTRGQGSLAQTQRRRKLPNQTR